MQEHRFGKNVEDAWAALQWVPDFSLFINDIGLHGSQVHEHASEINGLPDSISIGGISAGGQLSCVLQHLARDAGIPLKLGQ